MDNSRLVYSTEKGSMCPKCGKLIAKCSCKSKKVTFPSNQKTDGVIRIQKEKKGRKGKTVTIITGLSSINADLKQLASQLKNRCGTGGSIKDGMIIIQGDHRDVLLSDLKKRGYKVKLSGG